MAAKVVTWIRLSIHKSNERYVNAPEIAQHLAPSSYSLAVRIDCSLISCARAQTHTMYVAEGRNP